MLLEGVSRKTKKVRFWESFLPLSLEIFEYLTYHCESKVLSPVRNFRDCTFAITRRVKFAFLFLFNLHGKTLLRFSRYKRQIHEESSRIGENPSRLERDFFFFSSFSLYFSFHHPRESILYISQLWEKFFLIDVFFFIFPYISTFIYLQWRNKLLCIWNVCDILIFMKRKNSQYHTYVILFYEISLWKQDVDVDDKFSEFFW